VTGSRISISGVEASSPVASVERSEFLAIQPVTVESFFKELPALSASMGPGVNFGGTGAATINMRGLGDNRTLVLIDGRRPVPFNVDNVVDTNTIPMSLLQSVDILPVDGRELKCITPQAPEQRRQSHPTSGGQFNPEAVQELPCLHLHLFKQGDDDKWAITLPDCCRDTSDNFQLLTTPHLYRHSGCLQIYICKGGDGYVINDLVDFGCVPDSPKRQELLETTLAGFGFQLEGEQSFLKTTVEIFETRLPDTRLYAVLHDTGTSFSASVLDALKITLVHPVLWSVPTKDIRSASKRGQESGLSDDDIAFYDALAENQSAELVIPRLSIVFPQTDAGTQPQIRQNQSVGSDCRGVRP